MHSLSSRLQEGGKSGESVKNLTPFYIPMPTERICDIKVISTNMTHSIAWVSAKKGYTRVSQERVYACQPG